MILRQRDAMQARLRTMAAACADYIQHARIEICSTCNGQGWTPGANLVCPTCGGASHRGQTTIQHMKLGRILTIVSLLTPTMETPTTRELMKLASELWSIVACCDDLPLIDDRPPHVRDRARMSAVGRVLQDRELARDQRCTLCNCTAVATAHGFPVCNYHRERGESDPACPKCVPRCRCVPEVP